MTTSGIPLAVIGGSGLYDMSQLTGVEERQIETPYGPPSDSVVIGSVGDLRVAFLPRHGRGHVHTPGTIPYRANIYALKTLGVECIVAVSACGSLREDYAPGHVVIPDQLFDNTKADRGRSFFEHGLVAHVGVADPFCPWLSGLVGAAVREAGGTVHEGGGFVTIEGPRFSTRAESKVFRSWGMSIIGMTTSPEAYLAREAEICYAAMAHVTDYDVWHETEQPVSVDQVLKILSANLDLARRAIGGVARGLGRVPRHCGCREALAHAVLTARDRVDPALRRRLAPILGRYLHD